MSDLAATRGDQEIYQLTLTDRTGAPLVLDDAELWFTVKRHFGDADTDALCQKTLGEGIELGDDVGAATITLEPEDTADAPDYAARYVYDVQIRTADGVVETPLSGALVISPDVTRSVGS